MRHTEAKSTTQKLLLFFARLPRDAFQAQRGPLRTSAPHRNRASAPTQTSDDPRPLSFVETQSPSSGRTPTDRGRPHCSPIFTPTHRLCDIGATRGQLSKPLCLSSDARSCGRLRKPLRQLKISKRAFFKLKALALRHLAAQLTTTATTTPSRDNILNTSVPPPSGHQTHPPTSSLFVPDHSGYRTRPPIPPLSLPDHSDSPDRAIFNLTHTIVHTVQLCTIQSSTPHIITNSVVYYNQIVL